MSEPAAAPVAAPTEPDPRRQSSLSSPSSWLGTAALALAVSLLAVGWNWYETRRELGRLQEEVAMRLQNTELEGRETRTVAKRAEEDVRDATGKLGLLEARIVESQSQQVALEQLYQELSRGRDEWLLAEVEQTLAIASQQLQLAGNVPGALVALQSADSRLARSDRPQFIPLRRVLAKDIEQLKAVPDLDIPGITVRLDQLVAGADGLTLLADGRPQAPHEGSTEAGSMLGRLGALVWGEIRQLVRIQRLDNADQALLSPEQSRFLRENLKLRLLSARVALMQRNEGVFKGDIRSAKAHLEKYFDGRERVVASAIGVLTELAQAEVTVELPTLVDSLAAIRTAKAAGDKSR